jgi:hypothetical protein
MNQQPDMKTPDKIDLGKLHKDEYAAPKKPVLIKTKKATFLAITGRGEPGGEVFQDRIGALYAMAFTIKMTRKFAGKQDYVVGKLEAQWWAGEGDTDFSRTPKSQWRWKMLIRTPDFIAADDLKSAVAILTKRGKSPSVSEVTLETLAEGQCMQMLHVGPYEREPETIALMKACAEKEGYAFHGRHHEIYLSDPRRVPPDRLKTILRMPVTKR